MKQALAIALSLLCSTAFLAQDYGNDWIDYEQQYYRFKVAQDGVYRISYEALQAQGVPVNTIAPEQFELIAREEQQAIYISGAEDGSFDPGDYIEVVGEGNDGWLDIELYPQADDLGNPHYSLVNDTIHYFISWNEEPDNLRYNLEDDQNFGNYLPPSHVRRTLRQVFSEQYNFGELLAFSNNIPDYVTGEGWMSTRFGIGAGGLERTVLLETSNKASGSAPSATCVTALASASNALSLNDNHHVRVYRGENDAVLLADLQFSGYQMHRIPFSIPHGQVNATTRINHKVIDDLELPSDQNRVAYTEITYSHSLDLRDMPYLDFALGVNQSQAKYRLEVQVNSIAQPIIYARGAEHYRIVGLSQDSLITCLVPNQTSGNSQVLIVDESDVIEVELEPAGVNGQFTRYDNLNLDSAFLIVTEARFLPACESYAGYRSLGPRDALIADADQLYDQFGGGIPKHFLGIRRYCDLLLDSWDSAPAQLFLVGKSIYLQNQNGTQGGRNQPNLFAQNLLPSFGSPGSDILFTSGLNGSGLAPAIPTGRLSAISNNEVLDYLDKVVFNESQDPAPWMKNVIHFGGGATAAEQSRFAGYLESYENIVEDTCFGGDVKTFLKESSLPIEVNLSDSISGIIEEGLSLITFFGHAGGGQFDQSIDEPQNLEWGSHPVVLVNSCFSGDLHQPGHPSVSEQYTFIPNKGSIGFIASVQQGFEGRLNLYSTEFYRQLSYKHYGESVGELMKQTIMELSSSGPLEGEARSSALMNLLQGDPAVPVFSPALPDLMIDESSVRFIPNEISPLVDSIDVQVVITNAGKTTREQFGVELVRTFPDGNEAVFTETLPQLYFRDTTTFRIPTEFATGFGINTFEVAVDLPNNNVPESDNFINNRVETILPITDGGVFPVIPYEFAIIPDDQVTLKASTGNPFIDTRDYTLQIDTTDLFNSPLLLSHDISQAGGVMNWDVPLTLIDSTVYYWRVAEQEEQPEDYLWNESSFQYIEDRVGWGQAHYFQFKKDGYSNVVYDRPERDFDFFSGTKLLSAEVWGNSTILGQSAEYYIDFNSIEYNGCTGTEAFHVAVIDPVTIEAWGTRFGDENPDNDFGNANDNGACRSRVEYYFIFRQNNADQMAAFRNMIENEIPDGHYVLIYTWGHAQPFLWDPETIDLFNALGAPDIASISSDVPFIYAGVMGEPGLSSTVVADSLTQYISLDYDMSVSGNSGRMRSTRIGPAQTWNTLHWEGSDVDPSDTARISLLGYTPQGSEVELSTVDVDLTQAGSLDIDGLVSASDYPMLRLVADFKDPLNLSPVDIERWQILYEPVPEAALNPALQFSFRGDTIQEGQDIRLVTAIENISAMDMDSLLVHYWIDLGSGGSIDIPYARQAPLASGEVLIDTLSFPSIGLEGNNTIWVEANPINESTGLYDQLEQYHFNNIGRLQFLVQEDRENPLLDVTFDGQRILDGDIVSAEPEIRIRLDDENPFLLLDQMSDTSLFSVFLTEPTGTQRRIYFGEDLTGNRMEFYPANSSDNISEIFFEPILEADGVYRLLVLASDKSGNAAGDINFTISFTVERESSITEVLNYPNPFSSSTRFVFTLTGVEVPDYMKIQILTVSGKVVKEIFKEELGDIHIGRNITDYAWDGRDAYGDPLGNGVYFYRVIVNDSQFEVKQRNTSASEFFKEGFGKMYLMR